MLIALLCSDRPLDAELQATALWRGNVSRREARTPEDALAQAAAERPDLILVDGRMEGAAAFVSRLRHDPVTHSVSIVAIGCDELGASDLDLLDNGANAILRLPPGADWDDRLYRLIHVPMRRAIRFEAHFQIDAGFGPEGEIFRGDGLNLSASGMLFETQRPLAVGTDLYFAFQLPGGGGFVEGTGTVVRLAGPRQYGLELTHLKGDSRQSIQAFVDRG